MLVIGREQRAKIGDPAFIDRVVGHFRRLHTRTVLRLSDDALRKRVVHGIEKGRSYGLTWEYSLTVFVAHMMTINPEFDTHPAIQRELRNPAREPDLRINELASAITPEEWEEAARRFDAEAYWRKIESEP